MGVHHIDLWLLERFGLLFRRRRLNEVALPSATATDAAHGVSSRRWITLTAPRFEPSRVSRKCLVSRRRSRIHERRVCRRRREAVVAELVRRKGYGAHFNSRAEGVTWAVDCFRNVRAQCMARLGISPNPCPSDPAELGRSWAELLAEASGAISSPLVISLDALTKVDLIDHPQGANILFLPRYLPTGIFFEDDIFHS